MSGTKYHKVFVAFQQFLKSKFVIKGRIGQKCVLSQIWITVAVALQFSRRMPIEGYNSRPALTKLRLCTDAKRSSYLNESSAKRILSKLEKFKYSISCFVESVQRWYIISLQLKLHVSTCSFTSFFHNLILNLKFS